MARTGNKATDQMARIAALEVENWNLKYPVGVHVTVEMDSGEMRETVTRSKAEVAQAGYAVIFLQGITGYYLLQRVTPSTGIREDPYTDVSLMFADGKVISAAPKERRKSLIWTLATCGMDGTSQVSFTSKASLYAALAERMIHDLDTDSKEWAKVLLDAGRFDDLVDFLATDPPPHFSYSITESVVCES